MTAPASSTPTAPGPSGGQMLRSLIGIRRDPLDFLRRMRAEYGPIVSFPVPGAPAYLVDDPLAARRVLVTNARAYTKSTQQYSTLALVTGDGLLTSDGEVWRAQRRVVQPAFHRAALDRVAGHVDDCTADLVTKWGSVARSGAPVVDVDADMMALALDIVGRSLFGSDLGGDAERLTSATLDALDSVVARVRSFAPAPARLPTPNNLRLRRAVSRLDEAVTDLVAHRRAEAPGREPDMLDLLMADPTIGLTALRDQIVTFIVAGHETVASALTWAWYLVGRTPSVGARLATEARRGTGPSYARAVMDETLRMYPPAWLITRRAAEADCLTGHEVAAGALVIISPWLLHRGPGWPEPEVFDPDRFASDAGQRFDYLPFGAGSRLCIGREMALLEGVTVLSSLAARFELAPIGHEETRAEPLVTLRPRGGLPMRVVERALDAPTSPGPVGMGEHMRDMPRTARIAEVRP